MKMDANESPAAPANGEAAVSDRNLDDLGIETVAADQVEASVLEKVVEGQSGVQGGKSRSTDKLQLELNLLNEIRAITTLLRSKNDAEDDKDNDAHQDGGVVHAVMRSRLASLKSDLQALKRKQARDASTSADAQTGGEAQDVDEWCEDDAARDDAADGGDELLQGDLVETERERLIRTGLITPFDALKGLDRQVTRAPAAGRALQEVDLTAPSAAEAAFAARAAKYRERSASEAAARPTTKLLGMHELPHIEEEEHDAGRKPWNAGRSDSRTAAARKARKRPRHVTLPPEPRGRKRVKLKASRAAADDAREDAGSSEDDDAASSGGDSSADEVQWDSVAAAEADETDVAYSTADGDDYDDTDDIWYEERLQRWYNSKQMRPVGNVDVREAIVAEEQGAADTNAAASASAPPLPVAHAAAPPGDAVVTADEGVAAATSSSGQRQGGGRAVPGDAAPSDISFDGGYKIPARVYDQLFPYQQVGVKWMWELHTQRAGGIIGDEMGLGKTVTVTAFLAGLHHSGLYKPSLVVAPVTTLKQWQRELRTWHPPFRVIVLHDTGKSPPPCTRPSRAKLVKLATSSDSAVLLTTYEQLRINSDLLLPVPWGYVVLDEGHKIRNPDANITLVCKQVRTVHRMIMSGSPIQNSLSELWSLFDFVFPGKLGTLPVFQAQFAVPIAQGGYSNASPVAVSTAYKCAVMLRDLISPYLLRRQKVDVAKQLPEKNEQVLFCKLCPIQRKTYRRYLASRDVADILAGKRPALEGITILRKICNHVDLLDRAQMEEDPDYGNPDRSGKLVVALKVLEMWKQQGHKALLFTQTQQMLNIIERHVRDRGYRYHRMDGNTAVGLRYRMLDDFNFNPDVFLFLLTTKVGGIGINLTGGNRVLLFDPDWNPSTDMQARERCWRLGQKRSVTIFRLITRGTIEEKVYHRQIYKQYLTNRILTDPRQKRFVASKDIHDLFTLTDHHHASGTETGKMFGALDREVLPEDLSSGDSDGADEGTGDAAESTGADGWADERRRSGAAASTSHAKPAPARRSAKTAGKDAAARQRRRAAHAADLGADGLERDAVAEGEKRRSPAPAAEADGDASILRELFDGNGLHSALNHAAIENANDPVRVSAERAASKVAARAAQALKQSRQEVRQGPVHRPTWTGRFGQAGAPGQRRFGSTAGTAASLPSTARAGPGASFQGAAGARGAALPSSVLIAQLKAKSAPPEETAADRNVRELMGQIVTFLQSQEGFKAQSATLISQFEDSVDADSAHVFKQVLKQVAVLKKRNGMPATWVLKDEFAP